MNEMEILIFIYTYKYALFHVSEAIFLVSETIFQKPSRIGRKNKHGIERFLCFRAEAFAVESKSHTTSSSHFLHA